MILYIVHEALELAVRVDSVEDEGCTRQVLNKSRCASSKNTMLPCEEPYDLKTGIQSPLVASAVRKMINTKGVLLSPITIRLRNLEQVTAKVK